MKNRFLISHIRTALRKQLLYPAVVLIASFLFLWILPIQNHLSPVPLRAENHFEDFYNPTATRVRVRAGNLYYTGYDYVVNGRRKGHYYYTLLNNSCQFYILPAKTGQSPELELTRQRLDGNLKVLGEKDYNRLIAGMASQLQWREAALGKLASPYIFTYVSPYHPLFVGLIVFLGACFTLSLFDVITLLYCYLSPIHAPQFRQLKVVGAQREALLEAEAELHKELLWGGGQIFLTPHYLVDLNTPGLVLPTDQLIWVYYHQQRDRFFRFHRHMSTVLHIFTKSGKSYDLPHKEKEDMDALLEKLRQIRPELLAGYTEQNRQAANQMTSGRSRRCI